MSTSIRSTAFKGLQLLDTDTKQLVDVNSLWSDNKTVCILVRRFGCAFCHHQSTLLMGLSDALNKRGIKMVVVGNGSELFAQKYKEHVKFPGKVYIDKESQMFKELSMPRWSTWFVLKTFLFKWLSFGRQLSAQYKGSDLQGDGYQSGGVVVCGPGEDSVVTVVHREDEGVNDGMKFCEPLQLWKALGLPESELPQTATEQK